MNLTELEYKTVKEIAETEDCSRYFVSNWARRNGVPKIGRDYIFTEEYQNLFKQRRKCFKKSDND